MQGEVPGQQTELVLQALLQTHFLTRSLMLTEGHWQVAEHSVANPPKTKLLKRFCSVIMQKRQE